MTTNKTNASGEPGGVSPRTMSENIVRGLTPNGTYFVALGLVFRVPLVDFERFGRACLG